MKQQRARYVICDSDRKRRVSFGRIICDGVPDNWVVRGPDKLTGKLMYWTQPNAEAARRYFERLSLYIGNIEVTD